MIEPATGIAIDEPRLIVEVGVPKRAFVLQPFGVRQMRGQLQLRVVQYVLAVGDSKCAAIAVKTNRSPCSNRNPEGKSDAANNDRKGEDT